MANTLLYGFQALAAKDFLNLRAAEVGDPIKAAIEMSLAQHNAEINDALSIFATPTTDYTKRYRSNGAGVLQPLDEYGRSRPIKTSTYSVGFPLKMGGTATGVTFVARAKMTVLEVNAILSTVFMQDVRWMRRQMLGALFDNDAAGVTFTDAIYGDIIIYGLANGDAAPLYYKTGSDSFATDTHYLAQAAAISDAANPFSAFKDELLEHPENGGQVIALVPTNVKTAVQGLAEYTGVVDPAIIVGANTPRVSGFPDKVPASATPLGYLENSGVFVAEWRHLPDNYIIAYTTEGDSPLAMRQDPEPELRGFLSADRLDEFPYYGEQWIRRAGFAGWNRLGALVQRVGNGSYAVPTGYSLLMAS